ncbi:hypothetical protein [Rhizobium phaseoli]|jgi:hypothetical protein|uniref:hypothetical protein n=1 Tax=Rhizobium phaseoli TaxID=396 RepID=UPI001FEE3EA6|nr:hypothetical protein [Rhizobium phaseoli]
MSIEIDPGAGGMVSGPYFSFPGYNLVNRHKSISRGDWVGNFSWLRRDGVFADIPGGGFSTCPSVRSCRTNS